MPAKVDKSMASNEAKGFSEPKVADRNKRCVERKVKTPEQALSSLMRLCSKSEKSSGDALRLMRGWGVSDADARTVLHRLVELRFIDDARYAAAYVRDKVRFSGWGVFKIRRMLTSKGIARDVIDRAMEQVDRAEGTDKLRDMLEKKMRRTKAASPYDMKGKLFRYGMGLGYGYEDVSAAVEGLIKLIDDDF